MSSDQHAKTHIQLLQGIHSLVICVACIITLTSAWCKGAAAPVLNRDPAYIIRTYSDLIY